MLVYRRQAGETVNSLMFIYIYNAFVTGQFERKTHRKGRATYNTVAEEYIIHD